MRQARVTSALLCLLLLAGCSSSAPRQSPSPVVEHGQPLPDVDSRVTYQAPAASAAGGQVAAAGATQLPAVVALLEQAEQQANAGELEAAAASLERAIRIDARNPVIWYHLATVRLSQGEPAQAAQLAGKSNSLAPGNTAQQARNWLLIAEARRQLNDRSGAAAAERRARELAAR